MAVKKGARARARIPGQVQRSLTKRSTYRLSSEIALELAVFEKVGRHGSRSSIIEEALRNWVDKNSLGTKERAAAMLLLESGGE